MNKKVFSVIMASATALATEISSFAPSSIVFLSELYILPESLAFIILSSKTLHPKYSGTVFIIGVILSKNFKIKKARTLRALICSRRPCLSCVLLYYIFFHLSIAFLIFFIFIFMSKIYPLKI